MFKKLKDKLAEEVKSSPQRIQQFAQAAQAAVTSASSSISDITNNDLFSIADNDSSQPSNSKLKGKPNSEQNTLLDVPLDQSSLAQNSGESLDQSMGHDSTINTPQQRRLSNSSFASDISFRLPSYESPSMYHLQSDMDVSASEAESFSNSTVSLDRVTKEQLYAAYRRTQERYSKYRTQYADLARHYKLLERENAKARSVLVETQDKALRRISELREQCTLEQSAKAHLEKALRVEIDERNMKIEALETKVKLLVVNKPIDESTNDSKNTEDHNNANLISLDSDKETNKDSNVEIQILNGKIEKLEQLLHKYKESLKATKEKNSQMTTELQLLNVELEQRNKSIAEKKLIEAKLDEAGNECRKLSEMNEELQNKIKTHEFTEIKENSTLKADLQKAQEKIEDLRAKIVVFTKREEENAISLAENKLSIHKELESKESEIKTLKDSLSALKQEVQSLNIVITDYKNNILALEEERAMLRNNIDDLINIKSKVPALESQLLELIQKCQSLEQLKAKADEEYKCLQLQLKQETAEKLAMIDRNGYLENRNQQLSEENTKKSSIIHKLETEGKNSENILQAEKNSYIEEINIWRSKFEAKEKEIREEREELDKLQSEIEKLLANHELIREHNSQLNEALAQLKHRNNELSQDIMAKDKLNQSFKVIFSDIKIIKDEFLVTRSEFLKLKNINSNYFIKLSHPLKTLSSVTLNSTIDDDLKEKYNDFQQQNKLIINLQEDLNNALNNIKSKENEIAKLNEDIKELTIKASATTAYAQEFELKFNNLQNEHSVALETINKSKIENASIIRDVEKYKTEATALNDELNTFKTQLSIASKDTENIKAKLKTVESDHKNALEISLSSNTEKEKLFKKVEDYKSKFDSIQCQYHECSQNLSSSITEIDHLKQENKTVNQNLKAIEEKNLQLLSEVEDFQISGANLRSNLECLKNEKQNMEHKLLELCNLQKTLNKVEDDKKVLSEENISLRNRYDGVTRSFESLEAEINELRKSHQELEKEKDNLNAVISNLENDVNNKIETEVETKSIQTEGFESISNIEELQVLHDELAQLKDKSKEYEKEISSLKEINEQLSSKISEQNLYNNDELAKEFDLAGRYDMLIKENDFLKEENKRFKSDIEGLQTYLTKISKENGQLNDKLREMIANDGAKTDSEYSNDFKEKLETCNDKIAELSRENMLLVEENLELKDQLQSQNYAVKNISSEKKNEVEKKYESALNAKKILENKLDELEQANRMINTNMQQTQQHNEKLRLTNQKLETRLDEALVSLRHLHALQENTELEYLRNILYEYLTGPGNHSVTLAKVIAAVVKFDDSQTQLILQKEKERQGFLRQLGLL